MSPFGLMWEQGRGEGVDTLRQISAAIRCRFWLAHYRLQATILKCECNFEW